MSNTCRQTFESMIHKLKVGGGVNSLTPFKSSTLTEFEKQNAVRDLSDYIIEQSKLDKSVIEFDFESLDASLNKIAVNRNGRIVYPQLNADTIASIVDKVKSQLRKEEQIYRSNPLILDESGNRKELIDFSNDLNLLKGRESFEANLKLQLSKAVSNVSFINNDSRDEGPSMINVVVTDIALNHNIKVYKNDLWQQIVKTSGLRASVLYDNVNKKYYDLYKVIENIDPDTGKVIGHSFELNEDLFKSNSDGKTPYQKVLETVMAKFENISLDSVKMSENNSVVKGFIKMMILANFDTYLIKNFADSIRVNGTGKKSFSMPLDGLAKYNLINAKAAGDTWGNDSMIENDIQKHTSSLVKHIAESIPFISYDYESNKMVTSDLNLGVTELSAVGAVLSFIPPHIKFKFGNNSYSIGQLFDLYDQGKIKGSEFLEILAKNSGAHSYTKTEVERLTGRTLSQDEYESERRRLSSLAVDDDLKLVSNYIASIKEFLYGKDVKLKTEGFALLFEK